MLLHMKNTRKREITFYLFMWQTAYLVRKPVCIERNVTFTRVDINKIKYCELCGSILPIFSKILYVYTRAGTKLK